MTEAKNLELLEKAKAENLEVQIFAHQTLQPEVEVLNGVFVSYIESDRATDFNCVVFRGLAPEITSWQSQIPLMTISRVVLTGHTRESRQREIAQKYRLPLKTKFYGFMTVITGLALIFVTWSDL